MFIENDWLINTFYTYLGSGHFIFLIMLLEMIVRWQPSTKMWYENQKISGTLIASIGSLNQHQTIKVSCAKTMDSKYKVNRCSRGEITVCAIAAVF